MLTDVEDKSANKDKDKGRAQHENRSHSVTAILRFQGPTNQSPSTLLVFFVVLALNCVISSISTNPLSKTHSLALRTFSFPFMIQSCSASRVISSNQRVDAPSDDDLPPLTGPGFSFTSQTPLGALDSARSYVDGAFATQRLIADPIIPLDRQLWVGIDTRTAYFANDFSSDRIEKIPQLLQAGMRRLVVDLWWDAQGLGWQLCPRLNRDGTQALKIYAALEQGDIPPPPTLELQRMGSNQGASQDLLVENQQEPSEATLDTDSKVNLEKRATSKTPSKARHNGKAHKTTGAKAAPTITMKSLGKTPTDRFKNWFLKKPRRKPAIKLKAHDKAGNRSEPAIEGSSMQNKHQEGRHRLAMNKGVVSSYNKAAAVDRTMDGITCSTGEDVVMLLQGLQTWFEQTDQAELQDILLIVLNLNELGNSSLGTRPPAPPVNGSTAPQLIDSPNTNSSIKALMPNLLSLKELFLDAFPSLLYSPASLEMDREDLNGTWWKYGPVGLDYYNTTIDGVTGKIRAPTGWPTSMYLRDILKRRIIVSIGANNLNAGSTYNLTDDFTTIHPPEALGPSMTNSSLLHISSTLTQQQCSFPHPGVMMMATGTEENFASIASVKNSTDTITNEVTWSFSSMSDTNLLPWSYYSGQLATDCGYSLLMEGSAPLLSFSEHAATSVWSWDLNQPLANETRSLDQRCGAMQSNGRWAIQDCNKKMPVACRKIGTSSVWLINDKTTSNYRDVACPEGYQFDVPRTARENQQLYSTLLSYWNTTAHSFYQSVLAHQKLQQRVLEPTLRDPFRAILDPEASRRTVLHMKRHANGHDHRWEDDDDNEETEDDDDQEDEDDQGRQKASGHGTKPRGSQPNARGSSMTTPKGEISEGTGGVRLANTDTPLSPADVLGGGMIWIDISSWQTAGCWVPGGVHGVCPYQAADNTVALQEIIKVSSIGGVIILVLAGMFLYLKCRRNVRLRKANKRRADVRMKIMRTEVETVPA
ncbi:hypothetical protein EMPS_08403 [Entomortierella parvispora]|uniref:Maintenance of telomere capping protein 6 n=1 Tax=Entomortierella parvispora TaxID=205924 RepID=A0A9P3LZ96_9FUNG|nr:hypothetical protein EMPS_08403 [Entomortierella parvispora]